MAKKFINLYIVDNSEQFSGKLEEIFFERRDLGINVIGTAIKYRACSEDIANTRKADVFLISASLPDRMGIELVTYLKKNINPEAKYIITVTSNTRNLVDQAMSAGADAFLQKPFNSQAMVDLIYELAGREVSEIDNDEEEDDDEENYQEYEAEIEEEEEDVFEVEAEDDEEEEEDVEELFRQNPDFLNSEKPRKKRELVEMFSSVTPEKSFAGGVADSTKPNKVITFTSPKSSGKTTVLVNVAAAVKRSSEYDPKIVIVDLNVVYPSVQFALHHDDLTMAKKSIYDLMDDIYELDKDILKEATIIHEPTGIHIINTPFQSIRDFTRVTKEKIKKLILFLREEYDLVLIDTSGNIRDDTTTIPLAMSDTNVLLFQSDFTSLVYTRKFVEMIQLFEESIEQRILDKTMMVLNRYNEVDNLSIEKARNTILNFEDLELNVPLYIPEEPDMTIYGNKAQFIVDKVGLTSERLNELAAMIYPFYTNGDISRRPVARESKSLFGSLLNRFKK